MKVHDKKWYFASILTGMLILFFGCSENNTADDVSRPTEYAPQVSSAVLVQESVLRERVTGSGIIQGQQEAVFLSSAGGTIKSVSFELGDTLHKGDVLLQLDDTAQQLTLSQLKRRYSTLLADVESKEELYARGAISQSMLNQARAELDGLEAQLAQAKDAADALKFTSPIRGSIAEKNANLIIGDTLQAGTRIARIIDLEQLRVTLPVGQAQVFFIQPGYQAEIHIPTPGGVIASEGTVRAVSAGSDARTGSWKVLVDFPNPAPGVLRAGMSANVSIPYQDAPLQQVVPGAALVRRDGKTGVFIIEDERARLVEVEILDQYGDRTAVRSLEGDVDLAGRYVLTSRLSRLRSGDPVVTGPAEN